MDFNLGPTDPNTDLFDEETTAFLSKNGTFDDPDVFNYTTEYEPPADDFVFQPDTTLDDDFAEAFEQELIEQNALVDAPVDDTAPEAIEDQFASVSDQFSVTDAEAVEEQSIFDESFSQSALATPNDREHEQVLSATSDDIEERFEQFLPGTCKDSSPVTSNADEDQQFAPDTVDVTYSTAEYQQFASGPLSQFEPVATQAFGQFQFASSSIELPNTDQSGMMLDMSGSDIFALQQFNNTGDASEQQVFSYPPQFAPQNAQNAPVNTTTFAPQPITQSAYDNRIRLPKWMLDAGVKVNDISSPLPIPEVVHPNPQPNRSPTPPQDTLTGEKLQEALSKVSTSLGMGLLRASLDASTRNSSQRQLLRVITMFGVNGRSEINMSPAFRMSLENIWDKFNTDESYRKMVLSFAVEKILKQNPEVGPFAAHEKGPYNTSLESMARDFNEKIGTLEAGDPKILAKVQDLLMAEFIHRCQLLEASKAAAQCNVNEIELKHQETLRAKNVELHQASVLAHDSVTKMKTMQTEMKKMEDNMKSMQGRVMALTTQLGQMQVQSAQRCQMLQEQLKLSDEAYQTTHNMNLALMGNSSP